MSVITRVNIVSTSRGSTRPSTQGHGKWRVSMAQVGGWDRGNICDCLATTRSARVTYVVGLLGGTAYVKGVSCATTRLRKAIGADLHPKRRYSALSVGVTR